MHDDGHVAVDSVYRAHKSGPAVSYFYAACAISQHWKPRKQSMREESLTQKDSEEDEAMLANDGDDSDGSRADRVTITKHRTFGKGIKIERNQKAINRWRF